MTTGSEDLAKRAFLEVSGHHFYYHSPVGEYQTSGKDPKTETLNVDDIAKILPSSEEITIGIGMAGSHYSNGKLPVFPSGSSIIHFKAGDAAFISREPYDALLGRMTADGVVVSRAPMPVP